LSEEDRAKIKESRFGVLIQLVEYPSGNLLAAPAIRTEREIYLDTLKEGRDAFSLMWKILSLIINESILKRLINKSRKKLRN